MNQQQFIKNLSEVASNNAVKGVFAQLDQPSGRSPDPSLLELSKSYSELSPNSKLLTQKIATEASKQTLYNVLLVLDGLIRISEGEETKGIELSIAVGNEKFLLNDESDEPLSSIFKDILGS